MFESIFVELFHTNVGQFNPIFDILLKELKHLGV